MSIAVTGSSMFRYLPIAPTQQAAQVARQAAPTQGADGAGPPPPPKRADKRQKLHALLSPQPHARTISHAQNTLLSDLFAKLPPKGVTTVA